MSHETKKPLHIFNEEVVWYTDSLYYLVEHDIAFANLSGLD